MSLGLQRSHQDSAELLTPAEERQEGFDLFLSLGAQSPVCSYSVLHYPGHWLRQSIHDYGKIPPFPSHKRPAMPLKFSFGMLSVSKADSGLEYTFLKNP